MFEHEYFWFDSNRHEIKNSPFIHEGSIMNFIDNCYKIKKRPKGGFEKMNVWLQ